MKAVHSSLPSKGYLQEGDVAKGESDGPFVPLPNAGRRRTGPSHHTPDGFYRITGELSPAVEPNRRLDLIVQDCLSGLGISTAHGNDAFAKKVLMRISYPL